MEIVDFNSIIVIFKLGYIDFLILVCRKVLIENVYAWWSSGIFQMLSGLNSYHLQKYDNTALPRWAMEAQRGQ